MYAVSFRVTQCRIVIPLVGCDAVDPDPVLGCDTLEPSLPRELATVPFWLWL